jgi:ABC-type lipoprotein export system ATPase subunit
VSARLEVDVDGSGTNLEFTFARFWKCALQVNPVGYSKAYRGRDHGLDREAYLAALLKECQEQQVALIGIADHGNVQDVDAIRAYLAPHEVVVLPGFEICTTEKIHWVCLFPEDTTTAQLNRYLGALDLLDPEDGVLPSNLGGAALLTKVTTELNGFCYAAHVTQESGVLERKQQHLWKHPLLMAAQIPEAVDGLPVNYKRIAENKDPNYRRERPMALINAKDVAKPEDLQNPRASCFIKMTRPSFEALCMAFKDPESRVRLHGEMQHDYYSRIERMRVDGGYLDGLDVGFSAHLNTVIGGRGTGKSTLLECLRYVLEVAHKGSEARKQGDAVIRENLGRAQGRVEVEIVSQPQNMRRYRVVRRFGEPARVIDEQGNESTLTPADLIPGIEIYGQNEIYELARDQDALVRVLDRYLPDRSDHEKSLVALQRKLKSNGERLVAAQEQQEELEAQIQKLPRLEEQVRQFDELGLKDKLKLVPLLEKERQVPARVTEEVERLATAVDTLRDSLPEVVFLGEKAIEELPHADLLRQSRAILEGVRKSTEDYIETTAQSVEVARVELTRLNGELDKARRAMEDALVKEFAKLPAVAGKAGSDVGRTYQALQREIENIRPLQARVSTAAALVQSLQQERRNLLGELSDLRNTRTRTLEREVKRLNRKLAGKLRLTLTPSRNRKELKEFLNRLPGIGDKGLTWVDDAGDLTIPALVDACRAGTDALLAKEWGVSRARAETICKLARAELLALETIDLGDRITLELNVAYEGEVYRPLERLSTGQQCTAILHLLLLDNPDPLVMDQPEDNLDNAFIADRIVHELRSAKTARQFIFATHNANIPVFGDAEWIGVFTATESHGSVPPENQGSIDVPHIRDEAARILDGGQEAFLQRQQKYGY